MDLIKYKILKPATHALRAPQVLDRDFNYAEVRIVILALVSPKRMSGGALRRHSSFWGFDYVLTEADTEVKSSLLAIASDRLGLTVFCTQTQTKKLFESVAKQHFQKVSCGSFDRKLL
ncbi:hypothetical protein [Pseudanabaena sp. UWO310]|uniref:hypothetical protein n=1 Tax=Pseudanabaena sp. UWO310 TaxID=2480795 RepID=UPI00115AE0FF|nr:hypothetical protein [Pseudanabaena sp. UWO310]TYQ30924.1 hypothetical protein PseudUWO310_06155 [Pseudanabaena sp. UWO310]